MRFPHQNVRAGIITGVTLAAFLSALATAVFVLSRGERFVRLGVSLSETILSYLVAGVLGGAIVGLLLPLGRRLPGALLLGFLTAVPLFVALCMFMIPRTQWFPEGVVVVVLGSFILGVPAGLFAWQEAQGKG